MTCKMIENSQKSPEMLDQGLGDIAQLRKGVYMNAKLTAFMNDFRSWTPLYYPFMNAGLSAVHERH